MIVQLLLCDFTGEQEECSLEVSDSEVPYIVLKSPQCSTKKFEGDDLFVCLVNLRLHLETIQKYILCNGSRVDVYPSGMSREMSSGRIAYVHRIGCVSDEDDVVDIFEPTNIELIGTVKDQKIFHGKWIDSIRKLKK